MAHYSLATQTLQNQVLPNIFPVVTEMITLDDEDIMKEAIQLEMQRNGQIYVVCNRIEMLPRIESRIRRLVPEARCIVAHGQMPPGEMEEALEAKKSLPNSSKVVPIKEL